MGRKTKKFIDKKKAATFQLLSRDSTDPNFAADAPGGDRIFVRVDNSPYSVETLDGNDDGDDDPNSRFADAPEDVEEAGAFRSLAGASNGKKQQLPEHVRREILELGFPDDGYNYLLHLRDIRNTGGGSAFYQNPKARLDLVPKDVKAYDASRVMVGGVNDEPNDGSIYNVASQSVNVKVQKVFDPEVAALLDDNDLSRFGSDIEDLEEDFVVQANCPESGGNVMDQKLNLLRISEAAKGVTDNLNTSVHLEKQTTDVYEDGNSEYVTEKPRVRRLLDEQFDLLERQEYGSDYEDEDDYYPVYGDEEEECLADKLKHSLNDKVMDELEIEGDYKAPADLLREKDQLKSKKLEDSAADLIDRCREYAEKYQKENEDDREVMIVEESSDESEMWDCETIVSTYSNLDNHPQKIEAPEVARRRLLSATVPGALAANNKVISLKGKEKLPVDFLPRGRKPATEKVKGGNTVRLEQQKGRQHGQESKEEKKERKSVVKEERREARRMKKETKGLYRCEAQRAQRVAAITGPSSIPLV
ncbi:protein LTV1 homolog [Punica granatum]|uniref:Uncharacterized protein n=2 Tax=Punica granatum TaxID=22663 RepID=A0A218X7F4_PUNGR|nr:protein LTV1 homolog [Punica granatum]XP_031378564.1 protein LTV1 homolog [Punica granatum]OWM80894.1 hypothetical protein CDL15_Pgr006925 [Punica granatum]PKI45704.1 hypothetical protein CRG98_034020 [Punica granatum]